MNLEVETKLSAPLNFALPTQALADLGLAVGIEPVKQTSTVYFDSDNFDLLSCGVALRFRGRLESQSPVKKGVWAIKFSVSQKTSVVSRYEYEVTGTYGSVPSEFEKVLKIFGWDQSLNPIAILEAERTTVNFKDSSGSKLFQIDDDLITVRSSDNGELVFREIEVELADPASEQDANRVVSILRDHGAVLSSSSSKLEQALLQDMSPKELNEVVSRYDADVVGQMIKSACFVLGQYKTLPQVIDALSALLFEQPSSAWRLKLVELLIDELGNQPKLDPSAFKNLLDRVDTVLYRYCHWLRSDSVQRRTIEPAENTRYGSRMAPFLELESEVQTGSVPKMAFASALEALIKNSFSVSEVGG